MKDLIIIASILSLCIHSGDYDYCKDILRDGLRDSISDQNSVDKKLIIHYEFCSIAKENNLNEQNFDTFAKNYAELVQSSINNYGGNAGITIGPFNLGGNYGQNNNNSNFSKDDKQDLLKSNKKTVIDYYKENCGDSSYEEFLKSEAVLSSKIANENIIKAWRDCMLNQNGFFADITRSSKVGDGDEIEYDVTISWKSDENTNIEYIALRFKHNLVGAPYKIKKEESGFIKTTNICKHEECILYNGGSLPLTIVHKDLSKSTNVRIIAKTSTGVTKSHILVLPKMTVPKPAMIEAPKPKVINRSRDGKIPIRIGHPIKPQIIFINKDIAWEEFKELIFQTFMDYKDYWAECHLKPINWDRKDEIYAREIMLHIKSHNSIGFLPRFRGGSDLLSEMAEKIKNFSLEEIFCKEGECSICFEPECKVCNFSCGCNYCRECFNKALSIYSLEGQGICLNHRVQSEHNIINESEKLIINQCPEEIINYYSKYISCIRLIRFINIKICKCGEIYYNETGYSKQFCEFCGEDVCFYCGETWDKSKKNQIGYCDKNCLYYYRLKYSLTKWEQGLTQLDQIPGIPTTRFCPKCNLHGAYGKECKFNTCTSCNYTFCFFCLKSENDCKKIYGKQSNQKCVEPEPQDLRAMFEKNRI